MPNVTVPSLSSVLNPPVAKPVRDVAYWSRVAPELVQFLDDPAKLAAVVRESPSEAMRRSAGMAMRDLFPRAVGGVPGVSGAMPVGGGGWQMTPGSGARG